MFIQMDPIDNKSLCTLRFLRTWLKRKVYEEKVNIRDKLVICVMNSAALVKERIRRATQPLKIGRMLPFSKRFTIPPETSLYVHF